MLPLYLLCVQKSLMGASGKLLTKNGETTEGGKLKCQVHGHPTRKMTSQSTAILFFAVSQMVPNLNTNTYQTHHKSTLKFHVKFHVQLRKIKPCHVRRPHLVLGVRQPGQLWPWAHLGPASESTFMQVLSKKWCGAWGMRVLG